MVCRFISTSELLMDLKLTKIEKKEFVFFVFRYRFLIKLQNLFNYTINIKLNLIFYFVSDVSFNKSIDFVKDFKFIA